MTYQILSLLLIPLVAISAQSTSSITQPISLDPNNGNIKLRIVFQTPDQLSQNEPSLPCATADCGNNVAQQNSCATGNCQPQQVQQIQPTIQASSPCASGNCGNTVAQQGPCQTGNCQPQQIQPIQPTIQASSSCASGTCGNNVVQQSPCQTGNCENQNTDQQQFQIQIQAPVVGSANIRAFEPVVTTTFAPITVPTIFQNPIINSPPIKVIRVPSYAPSSSSIGCFSPPCFAPRVVYSAPSGCSGNYCGGGYPFGYGYQRLFSPRRFFAPRPIIRSFSSQSSSNIAIPDTIYRDGKRIRPSVRVPTSYQDGNPVFNVGK